VEEADLVDLLWLFDCSTPPVSHKKGLLLKLSQQTKNYFKPRLNLTSSGKFTSSQPRQDKTRPTLLWQLLLKIT